MDSKEVFAKNLKRYMEMHNETQRALASIVGVSSPTINDWANGKKFPRIDKVEMLANYFGISKSDLIEDKSYESNNNCECCEIDVKIGNRIRCRREALEMSQDELARRLGYKSRTTINKIESGINDIPQSKVFKFADVLQTTPAFLMGLDVEMNIVLKDKDILSIVANLNKLNPEQLASVKQFVNFLLNG